MTPACRTSRKNILHASKVSGHGHIPTCFSVVEILTAVYETIRHRPNEPKWAGRDIFILSKGHASLAHYAVLSQFGYLDGFSIDTFGHFESIFGCHADRLKVPGIEASTGSLGHGIGLALGMALAARVDRSDRRVYALIGDGEANEGTVWESIMVGVNLKMSNLTIIYDDNRSHARGLQITDPVAHFRGFGCEVIEVDGHDVDALKRALTAPGDTLRVLVARTIKGFGCPTLVNNQYEWHRRSPKEQEYTMLMEELFAEAV